VPSYLYQISYSAEALAAMIKRPQDRVEALRKVVEKLGGKVVAFEVCCPRSRLSSWSSKRL
jgi:uncharacterized protein with GYD domain